MPQSPLSRLDCGYSLFSWQNNSVSTFSSGENTIIAFDLNVCQSRNQQILGTACPKYNCLCQNLWEWHVIKIMTLLWNTLGYFPPLHDSSHLLAPFLPTRSFLSNSAPSYSLSAVSDHPAHFWFHSNLLADQRPVTKEVLMLGHWRDFNNCMPGCHWGGYWMSRWALVGQERVERSRGHYVAMRKARNWRESSSMKSSWLFWLFGGLDAFQNVLLQEYF